MSRDFTVKKKKELLLALIDAGYQFQTVCEYLKNPSDKVVVLRHDVDDLPENSLEFARMQNGLGISGSFYFRIVPNSFDVSIMKEIEALGHEVGFHYETMDFARGDIEKAWEIFQSNLSDFRKHVSIETICMHGSPRSKYDNREIWKKYDYRKLGLLGEPYIDVDFNRVFYLTDTGRRWDGHEVSVRDKVVSNFDQHYHSTDEIIDAVSKGVIPDRIMITFHPQRWHDNEFDWFKELVLQNLKNIVKRLFYVNSSSNMPKLEDS